MGLRGVVPNASDNAPDRGAFATGALVFRDTGQLPRGGPHSYTAIVGSDREPVTGASARATTALASGRTCSADADSRADAEECDDGPFGHGTGGRLTYQLKLPGAARDRSGSPWPGSENSPAEAVPSSAS